MYISLHNQTHYSILDALSSPEDLLIKAKELNMPAVAITDHGTFISIWEAYKLSKKHKIKLIVGCEFFFKRDIKQKHFNHIILLAKNAVGYKNMLSLNFEAFKNSPETSKKMYPVVTWDLLEKYSEGVIFLSACGAGILAESIMNQDIASAEMDLERLIKIFSADNIGIEIQSNNLKRRASGYLYEVDQTLINRQLVKLAEKYSLRIVPTSNSHYISKEDHEIHDVQLAIASKQSKFSNFRLKYDTPDFYVKSEEEMIKFFTRVHGVEKAKEWCENTKYFADLCEEPVWIDPKYTNPSGKEMPSFPVEDQPDLNEFNLWLNSDRSSEKIRSLPLDYQYLRYRVDKGMVKRGIDSNPEYYARLETEFDVIESKDFSSYMLVVMDFIEYARKNNISIGSGRGSVGGSLIAYCINIHQCDPIQYGLIFERFLNKEKSGFPDIDQDISSVGRESVKKYLTDKYGINNTAQVSNIGKITPKVYARDISRSYEFGGSRESAVKVGNMIADSIDAKAHDLDTIDSGFFQESCKLYPQILSNKKLIGKPRSWATHAAGIVLGKRQLKGLVPLRVDKNNKVCLELTKESTEELGLVKMDLLGLKTLDIIDLCFNLIKKYGKQIPDEIPLDDQKTYDLITSGDNGCVFQLGGSGGTNALCMKMKSSSIEDISAINGLARPALKDYRDPFVETKHGERKYSLLHPKLERSFGKTYGFGLYEESLLFLAQDIAGWDLNKADRLRKMTKDKGKYPEKQAALRQEFIDDSVKNSIEKKIAEKIWDEVIEGFSGYGFNKSHSIMYSVISYHTAYLKAHFPIEFLLANLILESEGAKQTRDNNILKIKDELRNRGIKVLPPNINKSEMEFSLIDNNTILTGLSSLKYVSEDAIANIVENRPYKSFQDFMARVDSTKVQASTIQALAASGAFSDFSLSRRQICLYITDYRKKLTQWLKKHDSSQEEFIYPWVPIDEWSGKEIYALEEKFIGESFTSSVRIAYSNIYKMQHQTISQVDQYPDKTKINSVAGILSDPFEITIKKEGKLCGKKMYKFKFEDFNGNSCSVTVFPDALEKLEFSLKKISKLKKIPDKFAICFSATANIYNDQFGLVMSDIYKIDLPPALPVDFKEKKSLKKDEIITKTLSSVIDEMIEEGVLTDDE